MGQDPFLAKIATQFQENCKSKIPNHLQQMAKKSQEKLIKRRRKIQKK